jgi:hypothetical protein
LRHALYAAGERVSFEERSSLSSSKLTQSKHRFELFGALKVFVQLVAHAEILVNRVRGVTLMKTFDGSTIVQQKIESALAKYPADSLTPREVLMTIPINYDEREEMAQRLNFAITKQILSQAEAFLKANPPQTKKSFAMKVLPKDISYTDKRAEEEAYKQQVTDGVLKAISAALATES